MASMFDRYGLKEVANVSVIALDNDERNGIKAGDLVLYLDTLKVTTIEQTAESVDAQGGWGNPKLVSWDYGKEITLNIEDALLSPESMNIMVGGAIRKSGDTESEYVKVTRTSAIINFEDFADGKFNDTYGATVVTVPAEYRLINLTKGTRYSVGLKDKDGKPVVYEDGAKPANTDKVRISWEEDMKSVNDAVEITISPSTFPGTYKFIGDTLLRSEETGKDSPYQWVLNKAKISSEVTFTMEAEGDPATFSFTVTALRATNDKGDYEMMKFIKYNIPAGGSNTSKPGAGTDTESGESGNP